MLGAFVTEDNLSNEPRAPLLCPHLQCLTIDITFMFGNDAVLLSKLQSFLAFRVDVGKPLHKVSLHDSKVSMCDLQPFESLREYGVEVMFD
jgi:hypothetical protein